jgi:hypothetical protein
MRIMSRWKYKPLFDIKWREPYGFTRVVHKLQERITPWWTRPFWGIVTSAILFVVWNSLKSAAIGTFLVFIVSVVVGFGIIYFVALVHYFVSREIGLGEKALVTIAGQNTQGWPYEQMSKVEFTRQTFEGREFDLMVVSMKNSRALTLGLSEKVDRSQVIEFLRSKGVTALEIAWDQTRDSHLLGERQWGHK